MNRAKRQTHQVTPQRSVLTHAQVGTSRPLVLDLGGWCISVRTQSRSLPLPAHGWYVRRIPRPR